MSNRISLSRASEPAGAVAAATEPLAVGDGLPGRAITTRVLQPLPNYYGGKGLVALIIDDGESGQLMSTAGVGGLTPGISPETYLQALGMPLGIAMIADNIGASGYYTAAQLRDRYLNRGWEIISHSKTHTDREMTAAAIEEETVQARDMLEVLADSTQAYTSAGIRVNGFVSPGVWSAVAGNYDANACYWASCLLREATPTTDAIAVNKACSEIDGVANRVGVSVVNRTGEAGSFTSVTFTVSGTLYDGSTSTENITVTGTSVSNGRGYGALGRKYWLSVTSITPSVSQSAGWKYSAGLVGDAFADNPLKAGNALFTAIRKTYAWSTAYIGPYTSGRHLCSRMAWPSTVAGVLQCAVPGRRTIIYCHASPTGNSIPSSFKAVLDTLQNLRAAGRIEVVTPSALFALADGVPEPEWPDIWADAGFLADDRIAESSALDLRSTIGMYFYSPGANGTFYARERNAQTGRLCLEMARAAQGAQAAVQFYYLLGGVSRDCALRVCFDAKLTQPGASASYITLQLTRYAPNEISMLETLGNVYLDGGALDKGIPIAGEDGWKRYNALFRIPYWNAQSAPALRFLIPDAAALDGLTALLDSIRVFPA